MARVEPKPSERVLQAIEAGGTPACDGLAAVSAWRFQFRKGRGDYRNLDVRAGNRSVQVSISPSGRSVRVFVDGLEVGGYGGLVGPT